MSRVASSLESSSLPKVREVRRSVGGILRDCLAHRIRRDRPAHPHLKWKLGRERLRGASGSPTADLLHHQRRGCRLDWTGSVDRLEVLRPENTGQRFCLNRITHLVGFIHSQSRDHFTSNHETRHPAWQLLVQRGRKCDSRQEQQRHRSVLLQTSRNMPID